jgi:hypothetical protein
VCPTLHSADAPNSKPYGPSNLQAYLTEALAAVVATLGGGRLQGGPLLPALLAGVGARLDSPDALVRRGFRV